MDRHAVRLFAVARSMLGGNASDAEDVVQETFAGAYKSLARFEERASVKTWLSRILMNQVYRYRRDRATMRMATSDFVDEPSPSSSARYDAKNSVAGAVDAKHDVALMLQKLSPEHRQVIVLRELEQMSYEEIAQTLGIPRGTVESRLHRARTELRAFYEDREGA